MSYQGIRREHTIKRAEARKVYIWAKNDQVWLECELYDRPAIDSNGQIPPELHIICPKCGGDSICPPSRDPKKKTVRIEYLGRPRKLEMPDNGEVVWQTALVTIEEEIRCGHPAPNGKGICGWAVKVTDSVASRV
jgi:hypothetical protein